MVKILARFVKFLEPLINSSVINTTTLLLTRSSLVGMTLLTLGSLYKIYWSREDLTAQEAKLWGPLWNYWILNFQGFFHAHYSSTHYLSSALQLLDSETRIYRAPFPPAPKMVICSSRASVSSSATIWD